MSKLRTELNSVYQVVGIWLIIALIWLMYRRVVFTSELVDELLVKPIIFVLPVVTLIYRHKKKVVGADLGFRSTKIRSILAWGLGLGILLTLENLLIWMGKGMQLDVGQLFSSTLIINIIVSLATSLTEEVLYRGFILERLWQKYGNAYLSNLITSFLFAMGHLAIALFVLRYQGLNLVSFFLMIFVLGFVQGFVYTKTRSVYASTLTHFLWNFSNSLLI